MPKFIMIGKKKQAYLFVCIGLLYVRYIDWPARPDPLPPELTYALGANDSHVTAFYLSDLGGFSNRQCLWRIDAKSDEIALVVNALG